MKHALAKLLEALERFWLYLAAVALLLTLAFSLLSSRTDVPSELTKKNVQQALTQRPGHIVPYKAVRYKGEDGWTWESKKVLLFSRENDTYAVVKVEEGGVKRKPFLDEFFDHSMSDYKVDTRIVDYELKRESTDDSWYIDTTDGKQLRRYIFVKYYLKFEENSRK